MLKIYVKKIEFLFYLESFLLNFHEFIFNDELNINLNKEEFMQLMIINFEQINLFLNQNLIFVSEYLEEHKNFVFMKIITENQLNFIKTSKLSVEQEQYLLLKIKDNLIDKDFILNSLLLEDYFYKNYINLIYINNDKLIEDLIYTVFIFCNELIMIIQNNEYDLILLNNLLLTKIKSFLAKDIINLIDKYV